MKNLKRLSLFSLLIFFVQTRPDACDNCIIATGVCGAAICVVYVSYVSNHIKSWNNGALGTYSIWDCI